MKARNVVVVAPFAPDGPSAHLGAAKKIELVLGLVHRLGFNVHLVDSSHPTLSFAAPIIGRASHAGVTPVTLWRPFCLPNRKLGKLLNVMASGFFFRRLRYLQPAFVWVYNSYSFEASAALYMKRRARTPVVLELEDLPLARRRSFNPKPWLDQRYFPKLLKAADLVTYVNAATQRQYEANSRRSMLFPSLLQQSLVDAPPRTRFADTSRRVGYFGGLETDKGADVLLAAVAKMPDDWTLVITGIGSLDAAFRKAREAFPSRLEFHGRVSHEKVLSLMRGCDAIVNPHTSITLMREGVFPFKVCEALASGALLISTELPAIDIDFSRSVLPFDGSAGGFIEALSLAAPFHADNERAIVRTRNEICERFSEEAVFRRLGAELDAVLAK